MSTISNRERIRLTLRKFLAGGPKSVDEVKELAREQKINVQTLRLAAKQIGVERETREGRVLSWRLPSTNGTPAPTLPPTPAPTPVPAPPTDAVPPVSVFPPPPRAPQPILETARRLAGLRTASRSIEIWRYEEGRPAYITTIPAADFSMHWLKRNLGGGRYVVEGIDDEIVVSGAPLPYVEPGTALVPMRAPVPAPAPPSPSFDLNAQLFALILEQQKALATRATTDPMQMALEIVRVIQGSQQAAPPRSSMGEMASFLGELEKLGIEVGNVRDREDDDDGPPFTEALGKFAPGFNKLADVIASARQHQPMLMTPPGVPPVAPVVAGPAGGAVSPGPALPAPMPNFPDTPAGRVVRALAPSLALITAQARMGTPAKDVAAYLLDKIPQATLDDVDEAIDSGDFVADVMPLLSTLVPPQQSLWYRELASNVRRIAIESREDGTSANGAGDVAASRGGHSEHRMG